MARIIIADDDHLVIEIVVAALSARGHAVGALADGSHVEQIVGAKQPDLLILDCNMPNGPGLAALRKVRTSALGYAVPILMLTARRSEADEEIAMRAGADAYLRKPFCPDELVALAEILIAKNFARRSYVRG